MLYTRRGDAGHTDLCGAQGMARISKSAAALEALGALDELNSYVGYCRSRLTDGNVRALCLALQHDLFTVQAELAGARRYVPGSRLQEVERTVDTLEQELPPITSFCLPGQTAASARFDIARTLARRAERRVVAAVEAGEVRLTEVALAYLNRLSSLLYALARVANHRVGMAEIAPQYYAEGDGRKEG